jgi:hypothetical protein
VIILLVIVLYFLKSKGSKEGFYECIDQPCNCNLNKNCIYQNQLDQCNVNLSKVGEFCQLEIDNSLKHGDTLNTPFKLNSQELANEIDTTKLSISVCKNL